MTSTLTQVARRMLELEPDLGRWDAIASGTATTIVVTALAKGLLPSSAYENWTAVRREAASQPADRERFVTAYAASTGTLTVGTMADTTFTSENLELLKPGLSARRIDLAVNWAINALHREDTFVLPTFKNRTRYPLTTLAPQINFPNDVVRIAFTTSPVLSQNRHVQRWNSRNSDGVLTLDSFTLAGASSSLTRSTTQVYSNDYTAAMARSGTDATLTQTVGIKPTNVDADSLQGETVTVVARAWCDTASTFRVRLNDGVTTSSSSYHTGGSTFEELSKEVTLSSSASALTFYASLETNNKTVYIDDLYLMWGSLTDSVRRDEYVEIALDRDDYRYDQAANVLFLPSMGRGQWRITTKRPYPQFPAASVVGGTADAYSTDAPLDTLASVAIWKVYFDLQDATGAARWATAASNALGRSLYEQPKPQGAIQLPTFQPAARRLGRW